jgi:hypothetical protein
VTTWKRLDSRGESDSQRRIRPIRGYLQGYLNVSNLFVIKWAGDGAGTPMNVVFPGPEASLPQRLRVITK